jgi:hypothetical protein
VDRDDPEGMHRGTLQLAHPTDKTKDQMLHEHSLKDLIGTHFKNFDNRTLMILDTCFGGSFIAKNPASGQDNPFQSRNRGTVNV